jgi:hypothetical protein
VKIDYGTPRYCFFKVAARTSFAKGESLKAEACGKVADGQGTDIKVDDGGCRRVGVWARS